MGRIDSKLLLLNCQVQNLLCCHHQVQEAVRWSPMEMISKLPYHIVISYVLIILTYSVTNNIAN